LLLMVCKAIDAYPTIRHGGSNIEWCENAAADQRGETLQKLLSA
jgi:hypothetical protein